MLTVNASAPLSDAEREAIAGFVAHYPTARAACIDALKYLQKTRKYVSDSALKEVAELLGMSTAELDEVATFYNLIFRRPVGSNVILLCDSITCWMMGREQLSSQITERIGIKPGETTKDGRITLLPIVCLGHCDHAPAMMVGDTLHGDVDAAKLDGLLQSITEGRE
jgi:NADH-quinone oxidoreductase subunit E